MKRWIGIALVIAALPVGAAVQADDTVNERRYGNCYVSTHIDALTDEEAHTLSCTEVGALMIRLTPIVVTLVWFGNGTAGVGFSAGLAFHLESHIDVAWRIDKGEVRTGIWLVSDTGFAGTKDRSVFDTLMDELPAGKRIVIKVGNEKAIISLDGSAAAVKDFRSRIAQSE